MSVVGHETDESHSTEREEIQATVKESLWLSVELQSEQMGRGDPRILFMRQTSARSNVVIDSGKELDLIWNRSMVCNTRGKARSIAAAPTTSHHGTRSRRSDGHHSSEHPRVNATMTQTLHHLAMKDLWRYDMMKNPQKEIQGS